MRLRTNSLRNQDMTTGSITKKMMIFAVPVLFGSIFGQLYNIVDSIVVGQYVGSNALAAVGSCGNILMVFYALMMGMNIGAGVVVSQYFGAKDYRELNRTVITLLIIATCITLVMIALGLSLTRVFLQLLNTPASIIDDAALYLRICFIGLLGQFYFYVGSYILRGMGDSRWPMLMVMLSSVVNIVLDLLFVLQFNWGVAGVAWATTIAQALSAVVVLIRLARHEHLDFSRGNWHIDRTKIRPILSIGVPGAVQQLALSAGNLIIQRFANGFGEDFIATMTVVTKVDHFALMPIDSLGQALTTFVGQNIGANREDRVRTGVRIMTLTIVAMALVLGAGMVLFDSQLIRIFTSEAAVITMGIVCIRIMAVSYWGIAIQQVYTGLLRGAGVATVPAIIMIACLALRIPFTYLLAVVPNDYRGIYYCLAGASILGGMSMLLYFRSGLWRKHNAIRNAQKKAEAAEKEA